MTHLCKSVLKISIINDVLESLQRQTKSISNHDFKKEVKGHPTLVHVPELAPDPPLGTFKETMESVCWRVLRIHTLISSRSRGHRHHRVQVLVLSVASAAQAAAVLDRLPDHFIHSRRNPTNEALWGTDAARATRAKTTCHYHLMISYTHTHTHRYSTA